MSKTPIQAQKGMDDILPDSICEWQSVEKTLRGVFESWNFKEIRTPLVESIELFKRSIGEETDIVAKEMFEFKDRGERHLALRPEMTASVVRSLVEHRLMEGARTLGLYYWGPMYRAERPQKGRKREFYQAGCELFSESHPYYDVVLLTLLSECLKALGLKNYQLKINHLGTPDERSEYLKLLKTYLESHSEKLSDDSKRRLDTNVLRIFDSKVPQDIEITAKAPKLIDHLGAESKSGLHFVEKELKKLGIAFEVEPRIVRGLDYYTGLVFEVSHSALGAQDAIGAGGRYDTLVSSLGGPHIGASGFALGIERLLICIKEEGVLETPKKRGVYFGCLSTDYFDKLHALRREVSELKIPTEADYLQTSIKKHLASASKMEAKVAVIIGESEMAKHSALVKDLDSGEQREIPFSDVAGIIKEIIHA